MKFLFVLAAILAAAAAQQQCSCAPPAPINIQLTCGGNAPSQQQQPPPPLPESCPAPPPETPEPVTEYPIEPTETPEVTEGPTDCVTETEGPELTLPFPEDPDNVQNDPEKANCLWVNNGRGQHDLANLYNPQENAYMWDWFDKVETQAEKYDHIEWFLNFSYPKPPLGWNGSLETLGLEEIPPKGSNPYIFYLCWPLFSSEQQHADEWNIRDDEDINKCEWSWNFETGEAAQTGLIQGGFPAEYKLENKENPDDGSKMTIHSPEGFTRPPQDWDGRPQTLGFPMPMKGTQEYNMLLCWPYDVTLRAQDAIEGDEGETYGRR